MNSGYRLKTLISAVSCHFRDNIGTFTRQSVLCSRVSNEKRACCRRFTTCARAYVKSVQKYGRKIREALISKEKTRMSGDNSQVLAPLQAAVKEKVTLERVMHRKQIPAAHGQ